MAAESYIWNHFFHNIFILVYIVIMLSCRIRATVTNMYESECTVYVYTYQAPLVSPVGISRGSVASLTVYFQCLLLYHHNLHMTELK